MMFPRMAGPDGGGRARKTIRILLIIALLIFAVYFILNGEIQLGILIIACLALLGSSYLAFRRTRDT